MSPARAWPRPGATSSSSLQNVPSNITASAPWVRASAASRDPTAVATTSVFDVDRSRIRRATLSSGEGSKRPIRCTGSLPGAATAVTPTPTSSSTVSIPIVSALQAAWSADRASVRSMAFLSTSPERTRSGRKKRKGLRLAQGKQAKDMVQIPVRQGDGGYRRVAGGPRVQTREALDLPVDVGRRVHEQPAVALRRNGDGVLRSRHHARVPRPREHAVVASTVPLRKAPSGSRAEDSGAHRNDPNARVRARRNSARGRLGVVHGVTVCDGRLAGGLAVFLIRANLRIHLDLDVRR